MSCDNYDCVDINCKPCQITEEINNLRPSVVDVMRNDVLNSLLDEMHRLEQRHCSHAPPDADRAWRELKRWVAGWKTGTAEEFLAE